MKKPERNSSNEKHFEWMHSLSFICVQFSVNYSVANDNEHLYKVNCSDASNLSKRGEKIQRKKGDRQGKKKKNTRDNAINALSRVYLSTGD